MRKLMIISLLAVTVLSCHKDEKTSDPEIPVQNYIPMHIGDYWVYRVYQYNYNGTVDSTRTDSTTINRDTIINGKTYYIMEGDLFGSGNRTVTGIVMDSSGCLVASSGRILFSPTNFTDTLYKQLIAGNDTLGFIYWKMKQTNPTIYTPASTYGDVLNYQGTLLLNDSIPGVPNPRYINNYYTKDIGSVFTSALFLSGAGSYEEKLIRYHINN